MLQKLQNEPWDIIRRVTEFSVNDLDEMLRFLEYLIENRWEPLEPVRRRALVMSIAIAARLDAIRTQFQDLKVDNFDEICDNGYSEMNTKRLHSRGRTMISTVCDLWPDVKQLKEAVLSFDLLNAAVSERLQCEACTLESIEATELRGRLESL
jgi:hypothetical protein